MKQNDDGCGVVAERRGLGRQAGVQLGAAGIVLGAAGLVFGLVPGAPTGPAEAVAQSGSTDGFEVDSVHSMVVFRIKHMGVAYNYGMFHTPEGRFNIDVENPSESFIDVEVKVANIDTGNTGRDNHLRGSDFFDARRNPTLGFTATSFNPLDDDTLEVTGDLTFAGQTREITIEVDKTGEANTPRGYKQGMEATFTIERSEWGMDTYIDNGALGDEVTLMVSLEGDRE